MRKTSDFTTPTSTFLSPEEIAERVEIELRHDPDVITELGEIENSPYLNGLLTQSPGDRCAECGIYMPREPGSHSLCLACTRKALRRKI